MDPSALGRYLRESRESKELTLEEAVRSLRIRRDILESFEQGEFDVMDSTVRVRGMLRNYARYLGLEEDRVLQYYESAHNKTRRRRFSRREDHVEPIAPRRITDTPPSLPKVTIPQAPPSTARIADMLRNLAMILVSVAAIAVIGFVVVDRLGMMDSEPTAVIEPTPLPGTISETPTNTPTITPRATVITDTPAPALGIVGIQIELQIEQRSWVNIIVDDRELVMDVLDPGFSQTFTGNDSVVVRAANAAALDVIYNGIQQDIFGARGQEVEIMFTTTGVEVMQNPAQNIAPTPTLSPTDAGANPTTVGQPPLGTPTTNQESVQPTPIPTQELPSPTPLFPIDQPDQSEANTDANPTQSATTDDETSTVSPTNAANPDPTATPVPTESPTVGVSLPLRATSENPTATKTG